MIASCVLNALHWSVQVWDILSSENPQIMLSQGCVGLEESSPLGS